MGVKWLERGDASQWGLSAARSGSGNRWLTSLSSQLSDEQNSNQANSYFKGDSVSSILTFLCLDFPLLSPILVWIKSKDSLLREVRCWFNFQIFWGNIRQISREKGGKEAVFDFLPCKYTRRPNREIQWSRDKRQDWHRIWSRTVKRGILFSTNELIRDLLEKTLSGIWIDRQEDKAWQLIKEIKCIDPSSSIVAARQKCPKSNCC